MLAYVAPFLIISALVLATGSLYYVIDSAIHSRRPKRIKTTSLNYINFRNIFPC